MARKRPTEFNSNSEIDLLGKEGIYTFQDYFDRLEEGYQKMSELVKKLSIDNANQQQKRVLELAKKEAQLRNAEGLATEEQIIKVRKKAQEDFLKEERKQRVKLATEVARADLEAARKAKGSKDGLSMAERQKEREAAHKDNLELYATLKSLKSDGKLTEEQTKQLKEVSSELRKEGGIKALRNSMNSLINSLNQLNSGMNKYASYSAKINARLQGVNASSIYGLMPGAQPFQAIETSLTNKVGITPYFKTEAMLDNLNLLVEAGIASNLEQKAFLQTAKDEIATTFDVANSNLIRIIKLQQQDSTAARLGMEAYLTKFLNNLVSSTDYLNQTFDSVEAALIEASSQMYAQSSAELEYVVQKWLGALTGVGLSETSAVNIAQALGYLGSGNIEALSGTNLQNLLVMAANRSNTSFADMLNTGLSASSVDSLMRALVEYMAEIGSSSSNVVRSSFAQTFGLSISDLRAAQQLMSSIDSIAGNFLSYSDMYTELSSQLSEVPARLNIASMIDTVWSNLEFGLSTNIAKNPALAAIWKVTDLIQGVTGGINIPFVEVLGTGFDLNTTIENLIKLGVVGTSSLGMIGDLISGIQSTASPSSILSRLGITSSPGTIVRGTGLGTTGSGLSTSLSAMTVTTSSGTDIQKAALAGPTSEAKQQVAQQAAETDDYLKKVHDYLTTSLNDKMDIVTENIKTIAESFRGNINVNVEEINSSVLSDMASRFGVGV